MLDIVTRDEWGSRYPSKYGVNRLYPGPFDLVVVHTGAVDIWPDTLAEGKAYMVRDERYHVETHGWNGIAYSFLVDLVGNVYEGRGWLRHGAHTENHNHDGHGIQVMGHGDLRAATFAQLAAIGELIREGQRLGKITADPWVGPHALYSLKGKTCPGTKVLSQLGLTLKGGVRRYSTIPALKVRIAEPPPVILEDDMPLSDADIDRIADRVVWKLRSYQDSGERLNVANQWRETGMRAEAIESLTHQVLQRLDRLEAAVEGLNVG